MDALVANVLLAGVLRDPWGRSWWFEKIQDGTQRALCWVTRQVIEQIFGFVKSYRWFCSKLKLGWKYDLLSCFAETALETIQLHLLGGFSWVCDLWILKILCSQLSQILPSSGLVWTEGPCQHASASAALWLQLCYLREVGSVSNFQGKKIFWELKKLQRIGAHASFCFVLNLVKGCVRKVQICTRTGSD